MSSESPQQVVFIDANVPDLQDLLGGLAPGVTAFVIDASSDGLAQIADILAADNLTNLSSISIVGHGAAGEIALGSTTLDAANLPSDSPALAQIGAALAPGGGIQLYACDVASGTVGTQFIAELSQLAGGATVAASTQDIGLVPGPAGTVENWTLDASTAPPAPAAAPASSPSAPFTQAAMANFQGDLSVSPINNDQPSIGLHQLVVTSGSFFPSRDGPSAAPLGIPLGAIETFAGTTGATVGGTADAAGQLLSISSNTPLFAILGPTYGSNGLTTFELPNLQDRFAVGTGGTSDPLGASFGAESPTLTLANMPSLYNGGSQPFDNEQASLQINYLIDVSGAAPSSANSGSTAVVGEIVPFLGDFAPDGYMFASGQTLSISQFQNLFNVIGTTYGGDGDQTFVLPDLDGKTIIGAGFNGPTFTLGEEVGQAQTTIVNQNLPTSGDLPIDNYQPSIALNYLICINGVFPSSTNSPPTGQAVLGQIVAYAGPANDIPPGWALCNGQLLSLTANEALFSLIGNSYGGNGQTTFALPNMQGLSIAGIGDGIVTAEEFGSPTITLKDNQVTIAALPPSLAPASQTGPVTSQTAIDTPAITGTAPPGAQVQLFDKSNQNILLGTTFADAAGNYTFVPSLSPGTHSLAVIVSPAADIVSPESAPTNVTIAPPDAYFVATGGGNATGELWRSLGTSTSEQINASSRTFTTASSLTQAGPNIFFVDAANGALWVTDGLSSGTTELLANAHATHLTAVGSTLFFIDSADNSLWTSDGTSAGTKAVAATSGLAVQTLTAAGNTLYFVNGDTLSSFANGSLQSIATDDPDGPSQLAAVDNNIVFVAGGAVFGSNGAPNGTHLFSADNQSYFGATDLTVVQSRVYFVDPTDGDLLLTDPIGTSRPLAHDISAGLHPTDLTATQTDLYLVANGQLEFSANFGALTTVADVSNPVDLTAVGNNLFFVELDGQAFLGRQHRHRHAGQKLRLGLAFRFRQCRQ